MHLSNQYQLGRKIVVFLGVTLFFFPMGNAIQIEPNVTFVDGSYSYVSLVNVSVPTIRVTSPELYMDETAYCDWSLRDVLNTTRQCAAVGVCAVMAGISDMHRRIGSLLSVLGTLIGVALIVGGMGVILWQNAGRGSVWMLEGVDMVTVVFILGIILFVGGTILSGLSGTCGV